jgi:hypothetical protein
MAIMIAVFIVGGRMVITMAGAITMPRSWSLRRNIITTIDGFWLSDESENPAWWPDSLLLAAVEQTPAVRTSY